MALINGYDMILEYTSLMSIVSWKLCQFIIIDFTEIIRHSSITGYGKKWNTVNDIAFFCNIYNQLVYALTKYLILPHIGLRNSFKVRLTVFWVIQSLSHIM